MVNVNEYNDRVLTTEELVMREQNDKFEKLVGGVYWELVDRKQENQKVLEVALKQRLNVDKVYQALVSIKSEYAYIWGRERKYWLRSNWIKKLEYLNTEAAKLVKKNTKYVHYWENMAEDLSYEYKQSIREELELQFGIRKVDRDIVRARLLMEKDIWNKTFDELLLIAEGKA